MKPLMVHALVLIVALCSTPGQARGDWVYSSGSYGDSVYCFATSGSSIFMGTGSGVFVSTNNGDTWNPTADLGVGCQWVLALDVNDKDVFAGTRDCGVFHSTDAGASWTTAGFPGGAIARALARNGADLFVGTRSGVYHSTDNGANWIDWGLQSFTVGAFAVVDNNILAGVNTSASPVYRSTDNGKTWTPASTGLTTNNVRAFATIGNTIFSGTWGGGVFISTDKGANWDTVNTGLSNLYVNSLATSGSNLFAGTQGGGVFISTDSGTSWTAVTGGLPSSPFIFLGVSGEYLLAGFIGPGAWRRPLSEMITPSEEFFDDFSYADTAALKQSICKWGITEPDPINPPPGGGQYAPGNVALEYESGSDGNRVLALKCSTDGDTSSLKIPEVFTPMIFREGTYAARVTFDDTHQFDVLNPGDGNVEAFFAMNNSRGSHSYSELDFEYLPWDVWSGDSHTPRLWCTSWGEYYNALDFAKVSASKDGPLNNTPHTLLFRATDGKNAEYFLDGSPYPPQSVSYILTPNISVYPDGNMEIVFNNWMSGLNSSNQNPRSYTLRVDWVYHVKNRSMTTAEVEARVEALRSAGLALINTITTQPSKSASVTQTVSSPTLLDFGTPNNSTATSINFTALFGSGVVTVSYIETPPTAPQFVGKASVGRVNTSSKSIAAPRYFSPYRWIISQTGLTAFSGQVMFNARLLNKGISNPYTVTVYCRAIEDSGTFQPLLTTYNSVSGELQSDIVSFGEFVLGSDDNLFTGVPGTRISLPETYFLSQNYPNPFNPSTMIRYGLPERSQLSLTVYNTLGQRVAVLAEGDQEAGYHEVRFDGSGLASGVYFYRLQAGTYVETRKLILLK